MVLGLGFKGSLIFFLSGGIILYLYTYAKPTIDLFLQGYIPQPLFLNIVSNIVAWIIIWHAVYFIVKRTAGGT